MLRAHVHANVWLQDVIPQPELFDPTIHGWAVSNEGYTVGLSKLPIAHLAIMELVRCNCVVSKCSGRWSCKASTIECNELCKCEEDTCKHINVLGLALEDQSDEEDESDQEDIEDTEEEVYFQDIRDKGKMSYKGGGLRLQDRSNRPYIFSVWRDCTILHSVLLLYHPWCISLPLTVFAL